MVDNHVSSLCAEHKVFLELRARKEVSMCTPTFLLRKSLKLLTSSSYASCCWIKTLLCEPEPEPFRDGNRDCYFSLQVDVESSHKTGSLRISSSPTQDPYMSFAVISFMSSWVDSRTARSKWGILSRLNCFTALLVR